MRLSPPWNLLQMTPEDLEDIRHRLPFVLTSDEIPEYHILYVGQQQQDELHCYVFDIAPKEIVGKKRYFQGRIWVDDRDFQIVKTYGKTVPDIRKKKGQRRTFSRSSPPGASKSTASTGSPPIPKQTTLCTSPAATFASAKS